MRSTNAHTNTLARIENYFIFNTQFTLTAREQKVILFLISNINPLDHQFEVQIVPLKEMHDIILEKRSGSFYDQMLDFAERISKKQIVFDSSVKFRGRKMKGFINWFQSIIPVYNDNGDTCLKFRFSEDLKPFLLELKHYTQIDYETILPLKSGFAIRMYQIFKAYRGKMAKHQKHSKLIYELQELRNLLGVGNKYKDWRNFKKRVVDVIEAEMKETDIKVNVTPTRKGRKVIGVKFEFWDKGTKSKAKKSRKLQVENLTFAQQKAHTILIEYGVEGSIALEMLSRVGGSETDGFEDWYMEEVIRIFESKTKQKDEVAKAGTLVNWFTKKKVFEQGDHFAQIMERLQERKKVLQRERLVAWENRLVAKGMTSEEFILKCRSYAP